MKRLLALLVGILCLTCGAMAQQRRPIDNEHPLWMIHGAPVFFRGSLPPCGQAATEKNGCAFYVNQILLPKLE